MQALEQWHWPGNIRKLENFLERSVILTQGTTLQIPAAELCSIGGPYAAMPRPGQVHGAHRTLEDLEREYILHVLRETGWVISGSGGAAFKLGMKGTTLQSENAKAGDQQRRRRVLGVKAFCFGTGEDVPRSALCSFYLLHHDQCSRSSSQPDQPLVEPAEEAAPYEPWRARFNECARPNVTEDLGDGEDPPCTTILQPTGAMRFASE